MSKSISYIYNENFVSLDTLYCFFLHKISTHNTTTTTTTTTKYKKYNFIVGNGMRGSRRPVSATGLRRPETDYAKHRKKFSNVRRRRCRRSFFIFLYSSLFYNNV